MDQNYDVDDYVWQSANNRVRLIGKIVSKPVLYLDNDKMKYYMVLVNIPTQHGHENLIPLVANEILVNKNKRNDFFYGKKVLVRGFLTTVKLTKDGKPVFDQCVIIKKITTDVPNFKFSNVGFVRGTMVGFTKINNERRYSRTFLRVPSDLEYDPNVCMTTEYPLS